MLRNMAVSSVISTASPPASPSSSASWVDGARVLAWPALVFIGVLILLWSRNLKGSLNAVLARIKRVKAGSVEVELTEQSATQVSQAQQEAFEEWRRRVNREFDREIDVQGILEKRERLIADFVKPAVEVSVKTMPKYRSTIHVPDILFAQTLYQLLDYYPGGGGRGRVFSIRRGILGVAWRLVQNQIDPRVSPDEDNLIKNWAMTREEAAVAGKGSQSFVAVIIRDDFRSPIGIFYMDSADANAFGPDEDNARLLAAIEKGAKETGLASALARMGENLRKKGPAIRVY